MALGWGLGEGREEGTIPSAPTTIVFSTLRDETSRKKKDPMFQSNKKIFQTQIRIENSNIIAMAAHTIFLFWGYI